MSIIKALFIVIHDNVPMFIIKYILGSILLAYTTIANPTLGISLFIMLHVIHMFASDLISITNKTLKELYGFTPHELFLKCIMEAKIRRVKDDKDV